MRRSASGNGGGPNSAGPLSAIEGEGVDVLGMESEAVMLSGGEELGVKEEGAIVEEAKVEA